MLPDPSPAPHFYNEPFPARHLGATDPSDNGATAVSGQHPRDEPRAQVWRQVSDDVAAGRVDPNTWIVDPGRIGNKDKGIP